MLLCLPRHHTSPDGLCNGTHLRHQLLELGDGQRSRGPVPWLGSAMMGRCESRLTSGIALMSIVLRVIFSKVRMPRSHKITLGLPCERMYSAASSHSSIVADMPRFSTT